MRGQIDDLHDDLSSHDAVNDSMLETESSISVHAGLGYNFEIGRSAFIRLDGKLRYIDADGDSGETGADLTAAIGWNFGG